MAMPRPRFALAAYVVIVVGATAVPYYLAWRATPPDRVYTGAANSRSDDLAPYLARMRAGARGEWTYRSQYAPGMGSTLTIRPSYTILGALTGITGAPFWVGYHAARLALGAVCLVVIFRVAGSVSRSGPEHWAAFVLATIGSGIGWLMGRSGDPASWSYDLSVSDLNVVHAITSTPHFTLGILLMLCCVAAVSRSIEHGRAGAAAWGGAAFGYLALEHTYGTVVLGGALAAYGLAAWAGARASRGALLRSAIAFTAAASPAVAWQIASVLTDPSLAHTRLARPIASLWSVATGLGILLLLALPGLPVLARRSTLGRILVAWSLIVPLLLVLPLPFSRRLVIGWQVPLGIAAGIGLVRLLAAIRQPALRGAVAIAAIAFASASTVDVFAFDIRASLQPELGYRTWLPRPFVDTYGWLQSRASPRSVVLGPYAFSNFLPVYTDLCVYFGHGGETPDAAARRAGVEKFYDPETPDAWRSRFLIEEAIDWVIAPHEGASRTSAHVDPERVEGLALAEHLGFIEIFKVQRDDRSPP